MPKAQSRNIQKYTKNLNSQKGIIHLLPIIAIAFLALAVAASSQIKTVKKFNPSSKVGGVLLAHNDVDGDNEGSGKDENADEIKETPKPSEFKAQESPKPTEKPKSSEHPTVKPSVESSDSAFIKIKNRGKTEINQSEKTKSKTEIKKDKIKSEFRAGDVKVKFEIKDGEVRIKNEIENNDELEQEDLDEIENKIKDLDFKVSTSEGKILVQKNKFGAFSNFPLQLDLETKQLIASTSAGARILTILPDQAIENMLKANVITKILGLQGDTSLADIVELGEKNGIPVYKLSGIKSHKLLGLIPIETEVKAEVSAETCDLVSTEQSMLSQVIDLLSN